MIRHSVDFQRRAVQIFYQAAQKAMQVRPQFFGNQGQTILCAINYVIQEIRVRHLKIVTHESSERVGGTSYWW